MDTSTNRFYLVGPHSTGKTTLANALNQHFRGLPILQETARKVIKVKGYTRKDIESVRCYEMQKDVLLAQFTAEEEVCRKYGQGCGLISDRAGIDPIMYAAKYCPVKDAWRGLCDLEEWRILRQRYQNPDSIVILIEPCLRFLVDDGIRMVPTNYSEWLEFYGMYMTFMETEGIPYHVLPQNIQNLTERTDLVISWASF